MVTFSRSANVLVRVPSRQQHGCYERVTAFETIAPLPSAVRGSRGECREGRQRRLIMPLDLGLPVALRVTRVLTPGADLSIRDARRRKASHGPPHGGMEET